MHSGSSVWKFHFRDILTTKDGLVQFSLNSMALSKPEMPGLYISGYTYIYTHSTNTVWKWQQRFQGQLFISIMKFEYYILHVVELLVLYYIALLIYKSARSTTNSISIGTKVNGSFSLLKQHWCCLLWIFLNDVEKPSCFWLSCMFFYSF